MYLIDLRHTTRTQKHVEEKLVDLVNAQLSHEQMKNLLTLGENTFLNLQR